MAESETVYRINGKSVTRKTFCQRSIGIKPGTQAVKLGRYPYLSDALGVFPHQVERAKAQAAKMGVPTEFAADGRAIITSDRHKRDLAESCGQYDRNGGYGSARRGRSKELGFGQ